MKRYLQEKIAFIQESRPNDEHVLIIPGAKTECIATERSRVYTIRSPLISRTTQYRALLDLREIGEIVEHEQPEIIESADPYQVGWSALNAGHTYDVPVVAFYHSHFAAAYLRGPSRWLGRSGSGLLMNAARSYTRNLYNRFAATLVPSVGLAEELKAWGLKNTQLATLGVNTEIFHPGGPSSIRAGLGIPQERTLLLYVGRLAPEKNTGVLCEAFAALAARRRDDFHLLVIGDGQDREQLENLRTSTGQVSWIPYCADSQQLAQSYRAADLLVHPGVEETFGLVALESQACGTPVVGIRGSYMDGIILHDQEAWADDNSPKALAAAIERFAVLDLKEIGRAAAELAVAKHDWSQVFTRLFGVYRDVIGRHSR
ncbi:MAG: glycosyltransferase [Verrucomicrobiota bacterium]|nr:glycosyltransferase [Verrucomicrobiota bacterium]